jgi:acyl-CoA thioester hydrolase
MQCEPRCRRFIADDGDAFNARSRNALDKPQRPCQFAAMAEKPTIPRREDYRAFRTITTRWMDNDVYGHMNNVVHYSIFDTAVNGWLIEQGVLDIHNGAQVGLVVETSCRYHAEIAFPDIVTAGIRVARLGNSSVRYEIGLFRNDDGHAAAEGFFVHVYVDRATRRTIASRSWRRLPPIRSASSANCRSRSPSSGRSSRRSAGSSIR